MQWRSRKLQRRTCFVFWENKPMSEPQRSMPLHEGLVVTIILCVFVAFPGMQPHGGLLGMLLFPFVGAHLLYLFLRKREQRKLTIAKSLCWFVVFNAIWIAQNHHRKVARADAEAVRDSIEAFRDRLGRFPKDVEEVNISELNRRTKVYYSTASDPPALFYSDTESVFYVYRYDFAEKTWRSRIVD
jgi:hypothetical protein